MDFVWRPLQTLFDKVKINTLSKGSQTEVMGEYFWAPDPHTYI